MQHYTIHYTSRSDLSLSYGGGILLETSNLDTAIGALTALAAYKETEKPSLRREDSKRKFEVNFYYGDEEEDGDEDGGDGESKGEGMLMYKFWIEGAETEEKGILGDEGGMGAGAGGTKGARCGEERKGRGKDGGEEGV
ncbi:hypothetical protein K491DRAFT_425541 [Lophiostoma macrostomum CBS 122681]|uniref:Uncharacterized protein n=1 Tax=Lophiostoma macrostomum CBS 122681 TaxID=1314788 RepID=A0A6A6T8E3_9PLEO|nr:hypothetical protein K491DRAFT_425541 [Lophiostoma macrostomum CBS 122681]